MKFIALFFVVALTGCVTNQDDSRLQGLWRINADATLRAMKRSDLPAENTKFLTDIDGNLCVSYLKGVATSHFNGELQSFRYHVLKQATDYDILRFDAPEYKGRNIRIQFADGGKTYWLDSLWGVKEQFEKANTKATKIGYLIAGADRIAARNTYGDSHFDFIISGNTARNIVADVSVMQPAPGQTDSVWEWELKFYKGTNYLAAINLASETFVFEDEEYFG